MTKQKLCAWETPNETQFRPLARPADEIMSLADTVNLGCNLLMARPIQTFVDSPQHHCEAHWCLSAFFCCSSD